jgi:glycosyltransferase involved in cell wall biosynthesis
MLCQTSKKKILLVSSSSGSRGGGEIYLYYLAAGLAKRGHRVFALCSKNSRMDELAGKLNEFAEVVRADFLHTYDRPARCLEAAVDWRQQRRCVTLFQTILPDVVHINQQVAEDGLDLVLAAKRSGIPFLSTIHIAHSANSLGARFGRLRDLITGNVLRRVNGTHIAVARRSREDLLMRFAFLSPSQVLVVPNGVLFPPLAYAKQDSNRCHAEPGETVIGSVGRLETQKAPNFALHVIATLVRQGFAIRYVWVGDGPLRGEFEDEARRLGIADRVRVTGWQSDVSACLQALDILLMPSNFEGLPLALLEAMGAGLCCCVSDVDGMAEVIERGKTGFLCPVADMQAWSRQIAFLTMNPAVCTEIGNCAKQFARACFSADRMAADMLKVYEDVLRAHESSRQGPRA